MILYRNALRKIAWSFGNAAALCRARRFPARARSAVLTFIVLEACRWRVVMESGNRGEMSKERKPRVRGL
jgi:hypothetical protein